MKKDDVTSEAALNLRKFPRHLLAKLKASAGKRGMTLQEYAIEILARSQGEVEEPPKTVTFDMSGSTLKSVKGNPADLIPPAVLPERSQRIRERFNMDSRDCLECGVAPNLKHKPSCGIGDRKAREVGNA